MDIISTQEFAKATHFNKSYLSFLTPVLMRLLKFDALNALYSQAHTLQGLPFLDAILAQLQVKYEVSEQDLKNIPAKGAFIAIANHPYGGLDGLLLLKILATVRPDFKIMANPVLKQIENISEFIIPINPFKTQDPTNIPGLKKALRFIHNDLPVGVFPAGEVSSLQAASYKVMDPEWQPGLGRFISKARVPVVPIYFSGSNSLAFNLLGLIHPALRTLQLPAELVNKAGVNVKVRIGKPIPFNELNHLPPTDLLPFLRAKTYSLGAGFLKPNSLQNFIGAVPLAKPVITETPKEKIKADILQLPSRNLLFTLQQYEVYVAAYSQIPHVMRELGRLREITFRAVGEGTNKETDLDVFDQHYQHLFIYDAQASLLVGAYRIGKGKEIHNQLGKRGFYVHTLFKMKKGFTPILKKSLELGRSFVRNEYQKKPLPLLLLWKGIATFLEGKTNYQYLLGPVSISDYFSATSKALMIDFIKQHFYDQELAAFIKPRKKFRYRPSKYYSETVLQKNIKSIKTLDEVIADIEPQAIKVPVLLKKYLQQNAKIIGFNIDPKFSNSLDGLLIMRVNDLAAATHLLLNRINNH